MDMFLDVNVALATVPINRVPLIDDADFKTILDSVAYNAAGLELYWNFVTSAGAYTQTQVTPSNSGNYLWTNRGNGLYAIQIPASGGASINNNAAGYGWFSGVATGVLPFSGPVIGFRAAGVNDLLTDLGTVDGVALGKVLEVVLAVLTGKATVTDNGGTRTITFRNRGDTADVLSIVASDQDVDAGARSAAGTIS